MHFRRQRPNPLLATPAMTVSKRLIPLASSMGKRLWVTVVLAAQPKQTESGMRNVSFSKHLVKEKRLGLEI
jgi:hypothetical protein